MLLFRADSDQLFFKKPFVHLFCCTPFSPSLQTLPSREIEFFVPPIPLNFLSFCVKFSFHLETKGLTYLLLFTFRIKTYKLTFSFCSVQTDHNLRNQESKFGKKVKFAQSEMRQTSRNNYYYHRP